MKLLEGRKVTKHFGGLTAVHEVDFHIDEGEIVGLIGPNGAGKTTLFNLISGTYRLSSGSKWFKGEDVTALKPDQICKRGVARTFQLIKLFGNMSVLDNVLMASLFGKMAPGKKRDAITESLELLEFVGLSAVKRTPAKELTLVNQKRLEVARGLATGPELMLLDELMAGLNPTEVAQSMELISSIRDKGVTIFVIEHVMRAIMNICDRIMVLDYGAKIAEGTPAEIAANRKVIEVYLGEETDAGS